MSTKAANEAGKAQLRVTHQDEGDYMARGIKLVLDGHDLGAIKSGKTIAIDVEPHKHTLRVDNTFHTKTVNFEAKPGERLHYRIWNRRGFGSWMVDMLGAGPMYLVIEKAEPVESVQPVSGDQV